MEPEQIGIGDLVWYHPVINSKYRSGPHQVMNLLLDPQRNLYCELTGIRWPVAMEDVERYTELVEVTE